ncbi:hypothetical protein GGI20_005453, partial [Coemansia sp. BCRC 34301]
IAEWLGLGDQNFNLFLGQTSYSSDDSEDVLVNDEALANCKPPGNSQFVYLKVAIEGTLPPQYKNRIFKLLLSRYKY